MSLEYIFAKPINIENIGNVYPIRLKDYDEFEQNNKILYISKQHFQLREEESYNYSLLDLAIFLPRQTEEETLKERLKTIKNFEVLFSLVLRKEVKFMEINNKNNGQFIDYLFFIDEEHFINRTNYDEIRKVIMKQNLMFEQKIFKNKITQEWAEKVIKAKNKNSPNIHMQDMIRVVSAFKKKNYDELENYSIYQIYADFYTIRKIKNFDVSIATLSLGGGNLPEDYADNVNLFQNPYDTLFVSKDKLKNLDNAFKE